MPKKLDNDDLFYEQFEDLDITTTPEEDAQKDGTKSDDPSEKESEQEQALKPPTMRRPEKVNLISLAEDDDVRPVPFRHQPRADRKRTSRNVAFRAVHQLHHANSSTTGLDQVPVRTMAYTIEEYLTASQPYYPASQKLGDELLAAAVESAEHLDAFLFSMQGKKMSQKQKVKKIQKSWWGVKKVEGYNGMWRRDKRDAILLKPRYSKFKITEDPFLFEQHHLMPVMTSSFLQGIQKKLKKRILVTRTTDDAIRDSSYFVREFFLPKSKTSLRIRSSIELPECFAPPTLSCGYYPSSATDEKSQKHYLMCRFKEAQVEYLNICYRIPEPPSGYSTGSITDTEL